MELNITYKLKYILLFTYFIINFYKIFNSIYNFHIKYINELTTKSKFLYYLPVVVKSWKRKYIFGNVEESELRWFSWNSHFMR